MGNNDIKVKDLSTTSSLSTDNKLMLLTDEANNRVQNITVENALANIISSNANNSLSVGSDKKLYTPDISGEVGDLTNLITTDKTDIVSAINEVKGDTNAITGEVVSASKGWLEEGKIYQKAYWYGEKIYNDVYSYNHSTNITGIDTIKPDDYTEAGTPTISADGIASGFSTSNYITKTISELDYTKDFDFISPIATLASNSSQKYFVLDGGNGGFRISQHTAHVKFSFKFNADNTLTDYTVLDNLSIGDKVQGRIKKEGTNLYLYARKNGGDWVAYSNNPITNVTTFNSNNTINLGWAGAGDNYCWDGSLDLNALKVYVNGNLVYQPCLLIPYNESSTGSKIVDVAYRSRVIDVYQQFGSANYYTIDEVNENCTLPMGEIYGFIEKTKENFSVPAYGNQNIGVTITDNLTYTCPDDGYIYCNNIQVTAGGGFDLSITRNSQSSSLISFGGISVDASVQIPFIYPVIKGDVVQILWSSTSGTYPILYFVPKEGV